MYNNHSVRKPTANEIKLIAESLVNNKFDIDYESLMESVGEIYDSKTITPEQKIGCAVSLLENYYVMVLEGYQPDFPSYHGTVFIILWGSASFYSILGYNQDKTGLKDIHETEQTFIIR